MWQSVVRPCHGRHPLVQYSAEACLGRSSVSNEFCKMKKIGIKCSVYTYLQSSSIERSCGCKLALTLVVPMHYMLSLSCTCHDVVKMKDFFRILNTQVCTAHLAVHWVEHLFLPGVFSIVPPSFALPVTGDGAAHRFAFVHSATQHYSYPNRDELACTLRFSLHLL